MLISPVPITTLSSSVVIPNGEKPALPASLPIVILQLPLEILYPEASPIAVFDPPVLLYNAGSCAIRP